MWRKLRISSLLFVEDIALVASLELFSAKYEPAVTRHLLGWGHISHPEKDGVLNPVEEVAQSGGV